MHFVFGKFEFSVAYIFVGEEFYFFEADDLGANENVSVGTAGAASDGADLRG